MKNSTIVLALLILVVGAGLYYVTTVSNTGSPVTVTTPPADETGGWQSYAGATASIKFSGDFMRNDVTASGPTDWRINANGNPGTLDFSATIPRTFEPNTNFGDAKLTLGESANVKAVADCLTPDASGGGGPSLTTKIINGVTFTVFTFNDAGAGNLYDSTSYRTVHNGTCIAVEYTIHYSQFANYSPDSGISEFDEAQVKILLDKVVGTVVVH